MNQLKDDFVALVEDCEELDDAAKVWAPGPVGDLRSPCILCMPQWGIAPSSTTATHASQAQLREELLNLAQLDGDAQAFKGALQDLPGSYQPRSQRGDFQPTDFAAALDDSMRHNLQHMRCVGDLRLHLGHRGWQHSTPAPLPRREAAAAAAPPCPPPPSRLRSPLRFRAEDDERLAEFDQAVGAEPVEPELGELIDHHPSEWGQGAVGRRAAAFARWPWQEMLPAQCWMSGHLPPPPLPISVGGPVQVTTTSW